MLSAAGSFLVRLLWPERCAACLVGIPNPDVYCSDCEIAGVPLEAACPGCAMPQAACAELCQACRMRPFPFRQAMAALLYGGAVAQALVRFSAAASLRRRVPLGRCLVPLLDSGGRCADVDAVLPVPLHPARLRAGGSSSRSS